MKKLFDEIPRIEGKLITLHRIGEEDAPALKHFTESRILRKYLPTFLLEMQYDDPLDAIHAMYEEAFPKKEGLFLGVYRNTDGAFAGIAEFYGYHDEIHKVSIGGRLHEDFWGEGIATEMIALMVDYLSNETDIEIIAASTLPENSASARALQKNGFTLVVGDGDEDWGYDKPLPTSKWIL